MLLGIIAEDESDVEVVREFASKFLISTRIGYRYRIGHGAGKLRRKCGAWAIDLADSGCKWIVLVHDLDTNEESQLRHELERSIKPCRCVAKVVLIPRTEIESWLLSDPAAIAQVFKGRKSPKITASPESLNDPKRYLRELVWKNFRKDYYPTVHNRLLAVRIRLQFVSKLDSFAPFVPFLRQVKTQAGL